MYFNVKTVSFEIIKRLPINEFFTNVSVEEGGGKLASFQSAPRLLWEISGDHSITFGIKGGFIHKATR